MLTFSRFNLVVQFLNRDVKGGFNDLSPYGVQLQYPPNAVTRPTTVTYEHLSQKLFKKCYPSPAKETETVVSHIVILGPRHVELQEPIIVTLMHSGPGKKDGYETIVKAYMPERRDVWEQIEGIVNVIFSFNVWKIRMFDFNS
jgi:hypothetical protein